MLKKLAARSLSSWIALGMALAILPLIASSIVLHLVLNGRALASFDDVATRYRDQIAPLDRLQVTLWEAVVPIDEYLDARDPVKLARFREARVATDKRFAELQGRFAGEPQLAMLVQRAEDNWRDADTAATQLLSNLHPPGDATDAALADRIDARVGAAVDKLRAAQAGIEKYLENDHAVAALAYERGKWLTGIAAIISLIGILLGVAIIVRVMMASVGRLVAGARKFSAGDREHRIEVSVPPELREVADELNRMIVQVRDAETALADQARRDVLTGLANRRAFDEALAASFARLRRLHEPVMLLALDIDHFKRINDTHGHAAGDAVLAEVGKTLATTVREVDRVFRTGGEEFTVLLAGTDRSGAHAVAERIRAAIAAKPVAIEGAKIDVTISVGLAIARGTETADDVMQAADRALYAAKAGGRNRVVLAGKAAA